MTFISIPKLKTISIGMPIQSNSLHVFRYLMTNDHFQFESNKDEIYESNKELVKINIESIYCEKIKQKCYILFDTPNISRNILKERIHSLYNYFKYNTVNWKVCI